MRHMTMLLMSGLLAGSLVAACNDEPTAPNSPAATPPAATPPAATPPAATPPAATPPATPPVTPPAAPSTAAVTVGDIFFQSGHNGSRNTAVDTVAVNGTVTWTWGTGESLPHSVQSLGSPSFTSSGIQTGAGSTYQFTFATAGTYHYNCGVHGNLMTGTIVVMAAAATPPSTPPPATPPAPAPVPPGSGY